MQKTTRKHGAPPRGTGKPRGGATPKRLGAIAEKILAPGLRARGFSHSRIVTRWREIAGTEAAAWSEPANITFPRGKTTDGTLEIRVASGRGPEAQMLGEDIITRCNAVFGYAAIARITITQTGSMAGSMAGTKTAK